MHFPQGLLCKIAWLQRGISLILPKNSEQRFIWIDKDTGLLASFLEDEHDSIQI